MLAPHPYAYLVVDRVEDIPRVVHLHCPVPGDQVRETVVREHPDPDLFSLLVNIAEAEALDQLDCTDEQAEFLISVGFLVALEDAAQLAFPCTLHERLIEALPRRITPSTAENTPVVMNDSFAIERQQEPVWTHHTSSVRNAFPLRRCWLDDPRTGLRVPFADSPLVERLRAGGTDAVVSDPCAVRLLRLAGALVDPETTKAAAEDWERTVVAAGESFARDRYCVVRDVIPPLQLAALRLHYRTLLERGCFKFGDVQVERRYVGYQDRIARFYHQLLTPLTSRIAREAVKPSYTFFASYVPGASLKRHTDRAQCEISISFLVEYVPDPEDVSDWPIFVESPSNPGRVVQIDLGPGDALFYRGREVHHHRDELPEGRRSTSLFFHYVPEAFAADIA